MSPTASYKGADLSFPTPWPYLIPRGSTSDLSNIVNSSLETGHAYLKQSVKKRGFNLLFCIRFIMQSGAEGNLHTEKYSLQVTSIQTRQITSPSPNLVLLGLARCFFANISWDLSRKYNEPYTRKEEGEKGKEFRDSCKRIE